MRNLMIQPNDHSGGAASAGTWAGNRPAGWVPGIGGALEHAGFTGIAFKIGGALEHAGFTDIAFKIGGALEHAGFTDLGFEDAMVAGTGYDDLRAVSTGGAPNDLKVDAQSAVVAETH